jgi:hypothetical protein
MSENTNTTLDPAEPVGCTDTSSLPGEGQLAEHLAEQPAEVPLAFVEEDMQNLIAIAMQDFFARTCVEVGTMLKQLGRRSIEIKPAEIQKFSRLHDVHVTKTPEGALRYELTAKGKAPSWAKKDADGKEKKE